MDEQDCVIKSAQINSRLSNTLPVFIVVLVMTFYTLFAFFEGHIAQKKAFQHDIKGVEEFHAGYMGNNKVVLSDIKQYEPFLVRKKLVGGNISKRIIQASFLQAVKMTSIWLSAG